VSSFANRRGPFLLLVGVLLLTGCSTGGDARDGQAGGPGGQATGEPSTSGEASPSSPPDPTPSATQPPSESPGEAPEQPKPRSAHPVVSRIGNAQWKQMVSTGTWRPECPVDRSDLRRVDLNHYTFSGDVRRGALVVNRDVAGSLSRIFSRLYERKFPIRKMNPVEEYEGDSHASLRADNTSAYNCRRPSQINAPVTESPHANGRAIDINPRENPWIDLRCQCWFPSRANRERDPRPGKIFEGGLVWRTFRAEGWIWQNIDVPDYMHFDTGYPSGPYDSPRG
jgi:D-alanyl-D-alanine carboxypeptidase